MLNSLIYIFKKQLIYCSNKAIAPNPKNNEKCASVITNVGLFYFMLS